MRGGVEIRCVGVVRMGVECRVPEGPSSDSGSKWRDVSIWSILYNIAYLRHLRPPTVLLYAALKLFKVSAICAQMSHMPTPRLGCGSLACHVLALGSLSPGHREEVVVVVVVVICSSQRRTTTFVPEYLPLF